VAKVESEFSLKERQINAGRREIEYKASRMKKLEADCFELRGQVEALTREHADCSQLQIQVEALKRENERLNALLRDEKWDE
jgi:hypothetical protein